MSSEVNKPEGEQTFTNPITNEKSTSPSMRSERGAIKAKKGLAVALAGIAAFVGSVIMRDKGDARPVVSNETPTTLHIPDAHAEAPTPSSMVAESEHKAEVFDGNAIHKDSELQCVRQRLFITPDAKRYHSADASAESYTSNTTSEVENAIASNDHEWITYYRLENGTKVFEYVKLADGNINMTTDEGEVVPLNELDAAPCKVTRIDGNNIYVSGLGTAGEDEPPVGQVIDR